jgi:hypothetical protein
MTVPALGESRRAAALQLRGLRAREWNKGQQGSGDGVGAPI